MLRSLGEAQRITRSCEMGFRALRFQVWDACVFCSAACVNRLLNALLRCHDADTLLRSTPIARLADVVAMAMPIFIHIAVDAPRGFAFPDDV